jgi:MFS family permease
VRRDLTVPGEGLLFRCRADTPGVSPLTALARSGGSVFAAAMPAAEGQAHAREGGRGGGLRSALSHRDFRAMLAAFAVSRAGDFLYNVALVVVVLDRTGSPSYVAALIALRLAPFVVLTPLAGLLADRVDRVRLMVVSDLARAVLLALLTMAVAVEAPPWTFLLLATLAGAAATPHMSSFMATLPSAVPERDLAPANSWVSGVEYVAMIAGPAASAGLLLAGPRWVPFAVNVATFLLSALLLGGVLRRGTVSRTQEAAKASSREEAGEAGSVLRELGAGVAAMRADRTLFALSMSLIAIAFTYGFELVYLVLVSDQLIGTGLEGVGVLEAMVGIGGVLGIGLAAKLTRSSRPRLVVAGVVLFCALPLGLLAFVSSPVIAYGLLLVEGVASVALDVVVITTMQRVVPADRLARVDGILGSLSTGGSLLGNLLAAPLLALVGLRPALLIASAVPTALALGALAATGRQLDETSNAAAEALAPRVAALAAVEMLSGLAPDQLERLAEAAEERSAAAGDVLLREGDPADDLYVLVEGECEALLGGAMVNEMSAPDLFGEIGVLQARPRTATVRAVTDCRLLRLSGEEFARAVAVRPLATPLAAAVETRLARTGHR